MDPFTLVALGIVGLVAGTIDAIAGGGGLLTVPALLLAGLDPTAALATNKGQSTFGAVASLIRFARSPLLDKQQAGYGFICGFIGSLAGVLILYAIPAAFLSPIIVTCLILAAIAVVAVRPKPGLAKVRPMWHWIVTSLLIGAYDGFFGPGTGTFLIIISVLWWGRTYNAASANAKTVNCASNMGSLLLFAFSGHIWWEVALVMGAGQLLGGWFGAHLVIKKGQGLVRVIAVCVALALAGRLIWTML